MRKAILIFVCIFWGLSSLSATESENAIRSLLERIDIGLSGKIAIEIDSCTSSEADWFEISQAGSRPLIRGNSPGSVAMGIGWYMKYVAHCQLGWNRMSASMPQALPVVDVPIRQQTNALMRYYLNYCTYSYSMAFWDWDRWQREIDWMALHGINMPLVLTGASAVWRNVLLRLGFNHEQVDQFIAGRGFRAWWLMNNLEGWGGPNSAQSYTDDELLQQKILQRMRQLGMQPVLPGYSGMLPHISSSNLGVQLSDPGKWLGFQRPAFLLPTSEAFDSIADIYYQELTRLYGTASYYSMDPFHEGGNSQGVDLAQAGSKIAEAMHRANPQARWVVQAWQENPRSDLISRVDSSSLVILDLQAENQGMWQQRPDIFTRNPWLYCTLLNFGGNVGLYGKIDAMTRSYSEALSTNPSLAGIGLTMEGIENNEVIYEMMCEAPWMGGITDPDRWIADYVVGRYGTANESALNAWSILRNSVYNSPAHNHQQGTTESIFCARPSECPTQVSTWASSSPYYEADSLFKAAQLLAQASDSLGGNPCYVYDLVDLARQANAETGRLLISKLASAKRSGSKATYKQLAHDFIDLILRQDSLLETIESMRLDSYLLRARALGATPSEQDMLERNARVQISTWGQREAADRGGLHDYAHREWSGMLSSLYAKRWQIWFDHNLDNWGKESIEPIDFYEIERRWTLEHIDPTAIKPLPTGSEAIDRAKASIRKLNWNY